MRALAVIPPMMLDARQRSLRYVNNNGLLEDPMEEYRERRYINVWTAQEKQIFKEKYLQHPKNFALISSFLEKKVSVCWLQVGGVVIVEQEEMFGGIDINLTSEWQY